MVAHFQQWFPQYSDMFDGLLHGFCWEYYEDYLHDADCGWGGCQTGLVVACLLSHATESSKANTAAAAVLLGLLPTTLGIAGSSTNEMGLLALRRPLLAALLAAGAPAVLPLRVLDLAGTNDPVALLLLEDEKRHRAVKMVPHVRSSVAVAAMVAALQYVLACAAVANVAHVSWLLASRTVCSFASDTMTLPLIWCFATLGVHAMGAVTVRCRLKLVERPHSVTTSTSGKGKNTKSWTGSFVELLRRESRLSCRQTTVGDAIAVEIREESYGYILLSWCTSIVVVVHLIFGTIVFSSMLFISTQDALAVVARYLVSTIICRAIAAFELDGLQRSVQPVPVGAAK